MLDISISKIFVIFVVALIVLGPEKATNVARLLGYWVGKIKRDINKIKNELDLEKSLNLNETITDIKKELEVFKEAENNLKEGFHSFNQSFNGYNIEHNPYLFKEKENNTRNNMQRKRKIKASCYSGSKTTSLRKNNRKKQVTKI